MFMTLHLCSSICLISKVHQNVFIEAFGFGFDFGVVVGGVAGLASMLCIAAPTFERNWQYFFIRNETCPTRH